MLDDLPILTSEVHTGIYAAPPDPKLKLSVSLPQRQSTSREESPPSKVTLFSLPMDTHFPLQNLGKLDYEEAKL